jgi:hypothetical protein
MGSNLETLRAHLERLEELARPDDRLRLNRTISLITKAEAARAKRQVVDAAAWRYALDRSAVRNEAGDTLDRLILRLNLTEKRNAELDRYSGSQEENMTYNSRCSVSQSSGTPTNSETRGKRLEKLAELSRMALTKYCDYVMSHQYCKEKILLEEI